MKPELRIQEEIMRVSRRREESSLPGITEGLNIQNKTRFDLEEDDEIFEGYGRLPNCYPYRQYVCYDRRLEEQKVMTAVMENDFLRAVFLPQYGGRLWSLTDKKTGANLLYTNDVIRPSNLAIRNAWFSGGVEWNIGLIGHTPFTMEPLFTARLTDEEGNPVLRMYEYERIRGVAWQMDFWLEPDSAFLNCRMRIVNGTAEVVPMYWWSNIAVPEYEGGRVLVPAAEAYTSDLSRVYKTQLPLVDKIDVTQYTKIPDQVDYFFHIPEDHKKYIANLNRDGYGLLQLSSQRQRGRKLFSWGHNDGSDRWQEFLTDRAGRYIEIQAGLGKTQYGCIPMAPHTAFEWVEQYGAVSVDPALTRLPFEAARERMDGIVDRIFIQENPEKKLTEHKKTALTRGCVILKGSGYAALENSIREKNGEPPLCAHLDFSSDDPRQEEWKRFLDTGRLPAPNPAAPPADYMRGAPWTELLRTAAAGPEAGNWYVHYHLGLHYQNGGDPVFAFSEFQTSERLLANPWAKHGLAVCCSALKNNREAVRWMAEGISARMDDLSYVKEGLQNLMKLGAHEEVLRLWERLPGGIADEGRIRFIRLQALTAAGRANEAAAALIREDFEVADVREGDLSVDALWREVCTILYPGEKKEIPHHLNFSSLRV